MGKQPFKKLGQLLIDTFGSPRGYVGDVDDAALLDIKTAAHRGDGVEGIKVALYLAFGKS